MVSDIIEPYPPPPFFDIREPYIVSSPLCNWGGGGSRIQTEYVSVGMFCEILVEGTKRWGFNVFFSGGDLLRLVNFFSVFSFHFYLGSCTEH